MLGTQCVRLNIRSALLIVLCFFLNGILSSNGLFPYEFILSNLIDNRSLSLTNTLQFHIIIYTFFSSVHISAFNSNMDPMQTKSENHKNSTNLNSQPDYFTRVCWLLFYWLIWLISFNENKCWANILGSLIFFLLEPNRSVIMPIGWTSRMQTITNSMYKLYFKRKFE